MAAKLLSVQPPPASERGFQQWVLGLARACGFRAAHFRPARTAKGWRTPVQGDGKGFPDLVLVKRQVWFVELKSEDGRLTPEQAAWVEALCDAGANVLVWKPSMWKEIVAFFEGRWRP